MALLCKEPEEASCSYSHKRLKTEEPDFLVLKCETDESNQSEDEFSTDLSVCLPTQNNIIPMFAQRDHLDIGKLLNKPRNMITNSEKLVILSEQWLIPPNFFFPMREIRGKPRKFSPRWLVEYPWMRYSVSRDAVWCVYCALFGDKKKFLATDPVRDWANIGTFVKRHINDITKSHDAAIQRGKQFLAVMKGEEFLQNFEESSTLSPSPLNTDPFLSSQALTMFNPLSPVKVEINCELVKVVLRIIILCAKGNISLHQIPNLINFQAATDAVLARNMNCSVDLPHYFSSEMHNNLLKYCANNILKKIVDVCNAAPYFSIIIHTSSEKGSTRLMHLLCVRFVNKQGHVLLREEFLGFITETQDMTENDLADAVMEKLQECGIDVSRMKGQGHNSYFQKGKTFHNRIEMHCPNAQYSHLGSENFNLAILQSCNNPQMIHLVTTMTGIRGLIEENRERLEKWVDLQNEDSQMCSQKSRFVLETDWMTKSDVLSVYVKQFTTIVLALEHLGESGITEAKSLRSSLVCFDTVLSLITGYRLLEYIVPLSESLQSFTSDLPAATEEASMLVNLFKSKTDDDKLWMSIFEKSVKLGSVFGLESVVPQSSKVQEMKEGTSVSPCQYWRSHLFMPFLEHIGNEITERLLRSKHRFIAQYLVPSRLHKLTPENETTVFDPFSGDVLRNTQSYQVTELDRWKHRWANSSEKPSTFSAAFAAANPDLYPNIATAVAVLLSMPISSQEMSTSVVPQVQTYLQTRKLDIDRQAGLVLMQVHPDLLTESVCEDTVSQFVMDASRKVPGL